MTQRTHIAKQEEAVTENAVQLRSSDPGSPVSNQLWINTTGNSLKYYNGSSIQTVSGGGGGGSSFAASPIDLMIEKAQQEHLGIYTDQLPNAIHCGFQATAFKWQAKLLENYTGSSSTMKIVANPLFLNPSDLNTDSTTGWTLTGSGANLTTSATAKVGSASLSFDKTNTAANAGITYAPTSLYISQNTNHYVWVDLPSTTGVTVRVTVAKESALTNSAHWDITTQYDGSPLVVGENLIHVDFSTTPTAGTGTGWTTSDQVGGYVVEVVTSPSTATLTGVLIDNPIFADSTGLYTQLGERYVIYNSSQKDYIVLDASSASAQGLITIGSPIPSNSYTADNTTSGTTILRNVPAIGGGYARPVTGFSATGMVQVQDIQFKKAIPSTLTSANLEAFISFDTKKVLRVASINVGANQISLTDVGDNHLQFVNGNKIRVVQVLPTNGRETYLTRNINPTLTANATWSGNLTTLTLNSVSGIGVGDIVIKDNFAVYGGALTVGQNEPITPMTFSRLDVVNDGLPIPQPQNVFAHYSLGGYNNTGASNLFGPGPGLTVQGTPSVTVPFFGRQFGAGNFSGTDRFVLTSAQSAALKTQSTSAPLSATFWIRVVSNANTQFMSCASTNVNGIGWWVGYDNSVQKVFFNTSNGASAGGVYNNTVLSLNIWYPMAFSYTGGNNGTATVWIGQNSNSGVTGLIGDSGNFLTIGDAAFGSSGYGVQIADPIFYTSLLTQSDVAAVANGGIFRPVGNHDSYKYHYTLANQSGNAIYMLNSIMRQTDADDVVVTGMGVSPV